MKNIKTASAFSMILLIALGIGSCKESGPYVNLRNGAISTTSIDNPVQIPESRNVLVEMITGVRCVNCPPAHVQLDTLINQSSGHVLAVEYHVGSLAQLDVPIPGANQDITSTDAQIIATSSVIGGSVNSMPSAAVDRVYHSSAAGIYDDVDNMSGYATTELSSSPKSQVNINLSCMYNAGKFAIGIGIHYTTTQLDSDKLSIFLTEDSVLTAQQLSGSGDANYRNDHIMRAAVTNPLGDIIAVPDFKAGRADTINYTYSAQSNSTGSNWNASNMHVVAFVHKYQNGRTDLLQAKMIKVKP